MIRGMVRREESVAMTPANVARPRWRRVANCYSAVDRFFPACGLYDLTEGIYDGDPALSYEQAQARQHAYLLDQARCVAGTRLLDLGCGYGTLLERARERGVEGVGITISREQLRHCRNRGLEVHRLDYADIPPEWNETFDAVIANGSIEHFVQPLDAATHAADAIYRALFLTVHRLLKPGSPSRRLVTTTIHLVRAPNDPRDLLRSPRTFPKNSDAFHWTVIERGWGGYYPEMGQLKRCAAGQFVQIAEVDGTEDYRLTSETWLRRMRETVHSRRGFSIALRSVPVALRAPRQFSALMRALFSSESWNWQFRPPDPPVRLLRQTWAAV
jgi:cyclopropane-fatty-acyl-phospholipid synthase